ncbi:hypothetical protein [Variovorax sp. YR566]|uniref:hypothetical protein n=1 Tax=Variovorax sp. YR566 TaxID=3450237 RepID=UPI003F7DED17
METSFAKGYEKQYGANGTVEISYKAERWGSHKGAGAFGFLIFLILVPASCAVSSPILLLAKSEKLFFVAWPLASMLLLYFAIKQILKTTGTLKITPNVGLSFDGKNLPYQDIDDLGTANETAASNPKGTAYVYANTHGQQVKITKYVPLHLAEAIANEIRAASGTRWN